MTGWDVLLLALLGVLLGFILWLLSILFRAWRGGDREAGWLMLGMVGAVAWLVLFNAALTNGTWK